MSGDFASKIHPLSTSFRFILMSGPADILCVERRWKVMDTVSVLRIFIGFTSARRDRYLVKYLWS